MELTSHWDRAVVFIQTVVWGPPVVLEGFPGGPQLTDGDSINQIEPYRFLTWISVLAY